MKDNIIAKAADQSQSAALCILAPRLVYAYKTVLVDVARKVVDVVYLEAKRPKMVAHELSEITTEHSAKSLNKVLTKTGIL